MSLKQPQIHSYQPFESVAQKCYILAFQRCIGVRRLLKYDISDFQCFSKESSLCEGTKPQSFAFIITYLATTSSSVGHSIHNVSIGGHGFSLQRIKFCIEVKRVRVVVLERRITKWITKFTDVVEVNWSTSLYPPYSAHNFLSMRLKLAMDVSCL